MEFVHPLRAGGAVPACRVGDRRGPWRASTLDWTQPIERSAYRTDYSWTGPVGTGARLASALTGWQKLRYEVTEDATSSRQGERYAYTPTLGVPAP